MSAHRPHSRLIGSTLALASSLMLSGCLGLGGKAPKQLISLVPATSAQVGPATTGTGADAIVLMDPESDRSLEMLRVPVRVNAATIAYLQDVAWVEKPSRQFRSLLAETLRAKTSRLVVEDGDFDVVGRTMVTGRLLAMGYDAPTQSVVVRVDIQRQDKGGAITSRRFESVVPGIQAKAEPVAAALGQASNDVAGQVASWLTQ
ncbi:ABC-type transport auxiliary lipoprotein family protein [Novosphingobium sp. 9U]|uniref:ABC-type transport auxiliary lipoprotein family protein n=1 Tax=Novosphingobium sp. 9U TaxID=2653158 RepID=UPI00135C5AC2|nr:ABC-type transport auxiliary lipoprotein family protein [Novosphingobium sp. 9U]